MNRITVFNFVTLNGYYKGANEDISWHQHDTDATQFSIESLKSGNTLLFGRITYEMMASFWPTQAAIQNFPKVAEGMNNADKIVFSRSIKKADWNNTRIMRENIVEEMRKLKSASDKHNMTLLGSGSILTQFAEAGLIDKYQFMVDPVVIGHGTPIFNGIRKRLDLQLTESKSFRSGIVLLSYKPRTVQNSK